MSWASGPQALRPSPTYIGWTKLGPECGLERAYGLASDPSRPKP